MAKKKSELVKKTEALRVASQIGCSGAHKGSDGNWMPCSSMEELEKISNIAETSRWRTVVPDAKSDPKKRVRGRRRRSVDDDWEQLGEKPIMGIVSLPGGGLVSGNLFGAKAESGRVGSRIGPEYVRDNDPDVFIDPESARARSRQLGCIGISRRISKTGRTVWMPCTNMTDYANRAGSTDLGRRNVERSRRRDMENAVRTVLADMGKRGPKRKSSISNDLRNK